MANARLGWFSPLGVAASIRASAGRVGLRVHCFHFSACTDSEWPLGELVLPPSASEWPSAGWSSGSLLPLFGMHRFGVAAGRVRSFAFRFGDCRWAGWPSGSPLPLFGTHRFGDCRWAGWPSDSLLPLFGTRRFGDCRSAVGLRAHCFRFSARTASEIALGGLLLPPSASEIALGGLAFGLTVSAFRHAPLRSGCWASSFFRLPLRRFRSTGWSSGSLLPLFGMHRFGVALGGLAFGLTASDFRHAPIRSGRWAVGLRAYCFGDCHLAGWPLGSPLRRLPSAGWPSGSLLPLFGMRRSAPPRRRSEDRRSTTTRQLFHFKTLIPTC